MPSLAIVGVEVQSFLFQRHILADELLTTSLQSLAVEVLHVLIYLCTILCHIVHSLIVKASFQQFLAFDQRQQDICTKIPGFCRFGRKFRCLF